MGLKARTTHWTYHRSSTLKRGKHSQTAHLWSSLETICVSWDVRCFAVLCPHVDDTRLKERHSRLLVFQCKVIFHSDILLSTNKSMISTHTVLLCSQYKYLYFNATKYQGPQTNEINKGHLISKCFILIFTL